jgi:hypothetical protein
VIFVLFDGGNTGTNSKHMGLHLQEMMLDGLLLCLLKVILTIPQSNWLLDEKGEFATHLKLMFGSWGRLFGRYLQWVGLDTSLPSGLALLSVVHIAGTW